MVPLLPVEGEISVTTSWGCGVWCVVYCNNRIGWQVITKFCSVCSERPDHTTTLSPAPERGCIYHDKFFPSQISPYVDRGDIRQKSLRPVTSTPCTPHINHHHHHIIIIITIIPSTLPLPEHTSLHRMDAGEQEKYAVDVGSSSFLQYAYTFWYFDKKAVGEVSGHRQHLMLQWSAMTNTAVFMWHKLLPLYIYVPSELWE